MSRFAQVAFTDAVRKQQEQHGSSRAYAAQLVGDAEPDLLGPAEAEFIAERDTFYAATVGETGWPYIQHRGGPPGFVHVLDEATIAFADVRGNRQYVTAGNLDGDDRVALFFMDYAFQRRLKLFGRARFLAAADHPEMAARLAEPRTDGRVESLVVVQVEGYSWNCPQHITPRYTVAELRAAGVLVVTAGGTPGVSAAQLHAGRTAEQPEYNPVRGSSAGTPSEKLDPPIPQTNLRRQPLGEPGEQ